MFCVYLTTYSGKLLPRYYVGSSSEVKISKGYRGSAASKQFRNTWTSELRYNPDLFSTEVLSKHKDRRSAVEAELKYQLDNDVIRRDDFVNKSLAIPNGFFGMDVSGSKNPMYGRSRTGGKHKGGENISAALRKAYLSGKHDHLKEATSYRMRLNNPSKNPKTMIAIKEKWIELGRNLGEKNGMYGKANPMKGKKLYTNGTITKCFLVGSQPEDWVLGRHNKRS